MKNERSKRPKRGDRYATNKFYVYPDFTALSISLTFAYFIIVKKHRQVKLFFV